MNLSLLHIYINNLWLALYIRLCNGNIPNETLVVLSKIMERGYIMVNIDYLRRLRRQNRMNLGDLARIVGKDRSTIWRYENGKVEVPTNVLFVLADYYQVSVDSLRWQESDRTCPGRLGASK